MNGAEALLRSLVGAGIDTCFSNPGTSEMHFVSALDRVAGMRAVPALAEGVATGAADGYGRMTRRPAATLLHCGPGLANGLANLHNARRARSPIVNLIGDLSHGHRPADPPLAMDIEALARTVSSWTRTVLDVHAVARDGVAAVAASLTAGRGIASLVLPSDVCWSDGVQFAMPGKAAATTLVDAATVEKARSALSGPASALLLGGDALTGDALLLAGAIARRTGALLLTESSIARIERGQGRPVVQRIPYAPSAAVSFMAGIRRLVLAGAKRPVFSFSGPDGRSHPEAEGIDVSTLVHAEEDVADALERLARALDCAPWTAEEEGTDAAQPACGPINPDALAQSLAVLMPRECIVVDESVSFGRNMFLMTQRAAAHDWLQLTGGAIGMGMPLATGAAVACPGRRVVNLEADGSALYTLQALWTQAREQLSVTTIIISNRRYAILFDEMKRVGAKTSTVSEDLLTLDRPDIDWVKLASGFGVEAERATSMEAFNAAFQRAIEAHGPRLIELVV
ncbi:acetolactate synthase large subunit [Variovorax terrae]|uniref:Acetolactate synthase large subunit n=1 Tax=Variovorax terrae TaxID=2923278 RepID=A0A9X1VWZ5_9BURK|nr:acetolactate synthase large subunit [Variovorax terrae]MCJ0763457.1 acetolactate synthase large subunit [Variovorax terrae]